MIVYTYLSNILFFNFILRLLLESYMNYALSAVINVLAVSFKL